MKKKQAPQKAHFKFSPSSAHRWVPCPGSIEASLAYPNEDSDASIEGTRAHECLETILRNGPEKVLSSVAMLKKSYPADMVIHAEKAAWVIFKARPKGATFLIEAKLETGLHAEFRGTTDAVIAEDFGTLHVIDFKYGFVPVEPKENEQLIAYAIGAANHLGLEFERLRLTIIQPRANHDLGPVRSWETDFDSILRDWPKKFLISIEAAELPEPPRVSGLHCNYCPARGECPTLKADAHKEAQTVFAGLPSDHQPRRIQAFDSVTLGEVLTGCEKIEIWIGAVREQAFLRLKHGEKIPGWKLVEKRAHRKWNDIERVTKEAKKKFGAQAFTAPELLSPAQLAKLNSKAKAFVDENASAVSNGLSLAPERDSRPTHDQLSIDFGPPPAEVKKPKRKSAW